jgi:DNA-binding PadR family transcriptional regulator
MKNIRLDLALTKELLEYIKNEPKTRDNIIKYLQDKGFCKTTVYYYLIKLENLKLIETVEEHGKVKYQASNIGAEFSTVLNKMMAIA